jgi:hypothetical protein
MRARLRDAMTFSIMTLGRQDLIVTPCINDNSIMTLDIRIECHYTQYHYGKCRLIAIAITFSITKTIRQHLA